jgi:flagella basal body P-ring formation protein FlgA
MPLKKILAVLVMALLILPLYAELSESLLNEQMVQAIKTIYPEYADKDISANVVLKSYQKDYIAKIPEETNLRFALPAKEDIARTTYAVVRVYDQKELKQTLRLKFKVQIFAEAYFAKANYAKTTKLAPGMFYLKKMDVLLYANKLAHEPIELQDKVLAGNIAADSPLYLWLIGRKPVVTVGEIIPVTFLGEEGVQLQMPAKVLQQGYLGDKILVQLLRTKKTF